MLIIRQAQMEVLHRAVMLPKYEAAMVQFLCESRRDVLLHKTDQELLALVRQSAAHARSLGADEPHAFAQYLELMLVFGAGFEEEPENSWASEALDAAWYRDGNGKIEALVQAAIQHLQEADDFSAPCGESGIS